MKAQVKLDLFLTTPENWGVIYLIRTGPAAYSTRLVNEHSTGHYFSGGKLINPHGRAVPTPDEQSVYAALGLPFVQPEERR